MIETKDRDLYLGGLAVTNLVEKYSAPVYIYDAEVIEERCRRLRSLLPPDLGILYSLKANPNPSIVAFMEDLIFGADVSSVGELGTALRAGFPPERIFFVGPSKSPEELIAALETGIACVIVESEQELYMLDALAGQEGVQAHAAIRVNPAFDSSGSKLKMGGAPRQFGIDEEKIVPLFGRAHFRNVDIIGLHAYLGTRTLDWNMVFKNTEEILKIACRIAEQTGAELEFVNVGGGLGVPYFPGEDEFDLDQFAVAARELFSHYRQQMPQTRFLMEMGRYLIAEAGIYVAQVRYVKESRGQKFVLLNGGMNHHQATTSLGSLIKHHFPMVVANKMDQATTGQAFICGPLCTPNDVLGKSVSLPDVAPGDLIAILKSGAYGFTASPLEFISHQWPGEVLVYKGSDYLIRDTAEIFKAVQSQTVFHIKKGRLPLNPDKGEYIWKQTQFQRPLTAPPLKP